VTEVAKLCLGLWVIGCGLWVIGYGLWVVGYGLWVIGYGLWVMGCGLSVMGCGLIDNTQLTTQNLSCTFILNTPLKRLSLQQTAKN
jgi:phenylacetate-coenzyme A ligase PaaK-like adenylate-forming protein